jgi:hypothetical protein
MKRVLTPSGVNGRQSKETEVAKKNTTIMIAPDIERSLTRMALQMMEDNRGIKKLALIGIHTGGVFLADRLRKIIKEHEGLELPVGYLDITLYRDDWSLVSQNPIIKKTWLMMCSIPAERSAPPLTLLWIWAGPASSSLPC